MRKEKRDRRRREKRAAVKAKAPVLVLCGAPARTVERGRVIFGNGETLIVRLSGGVRVTVFANTEGTDWVRGWHGEVPDAFRARAALLAETPVTRPGESVPWGPTTSAELHRSGAL